MLFIRKWLHLEVFGNRWIVLCFLEMVALCSAFWKWLHRVLHFWKWLHCALHFGNACIVLCFLEMVAFCSARWKWLHCALYLETVLLCSVFRNGFNVLCILNMVASTLIFGRNGCIVLCFVEMVALCSAFWKWLHCALYLETVLLQFVFKNGCIVLYVWK